MTTTTNCRTLEMEELEIVSGGTVTEFDELISALEGNGIFGDTCGAIGGHVPGANGLVATLIKEVLEDSLGFRGTSLGLDPNTYLDLIMF